MNRYCETECTLNSVYKFYSVQVNRTCPVDSVNRSTWKGSYYWTLTNRMNNNKKKESQESIKRYIPSPRKRQLFKGNKNSWKESQLVLHRSTKLCLPHIYSFTNLRREWSLRILIFQPFVICVAYTFNNIGWQLDSAVNPSFKPILENPGKLCNCLFVPIGFLFLFFLFWILDPSYFRSLLLNIWTSRFI